jgi:O-6-methylguanine DNA methyltransferase
LGAGVSFARSVLAVVRRIPPGRVATYGDVAALAGRPRASRAVGNIMGGCRVAGVPCHRVVASGGRLGGFGGSEAMKAALLRAEGITVVGRVIRRFEACRWHPKARLPGKS